MKLKKIKKLIELFIFCDYGYVDNVYFFIGLRLFWYNNKTLSQNSYFSSL